jgi:CheY-like chemotaxis protein
MKPGKYILLKVSDTGCGINKETLGLIFDPFFTTKGLAEGTGLGLSMVFGIVKSHGGQIDCQSEPGVGTSFNICLPALDRKAGSDRNAEKKLPRGCNETILLVDDEEIIRDVGETTLTRFGYTVMTAEDGEVAVDRYGSEQEQIDLVLLDLVMPGMGGKKCLEALLRINPAVKVIIASGYSESEHRADLIRFGAKGFVGKPYTASTLLSTVREVLDEE